MFPVSVQGVSEDLQLPALPHSWVLSQFPHVQSHLFPEHDQQQTWLHGPHHCPGLLTAQSLVFNNQVFTHEGVQDGDQVWDVDIGDIHISLNTWGQGSQAGDGDWVEVHIMQEHVPQI